MKKIGVDIIQPLVPSYRKLLFERLSEDPDLLVSIQCGDSNFKGQKSVNMDIENYFHDKNNIPIMGSSLIWQTGLKLINARGRGDVLVVCGDVHYVSNIPLIASARRRGVGIVWWGHARTAGAKPWRIRLRLEVSRRLSDCFLAYTGTGIETLEEYGYDRKRLFATGNSIDLSAIDRARKSWDEPDLHSFRKKEFPEGTRVLLFCSLLTKKTKLDMAIRAISSLKDERIALVVIGDGPMRDDYERLSEKCGLKERVRWLGEIREQEILAPWFLSADAFIYPGAIGLSLLHAFAYGLPVITHGNAANQMPEFEAMVPGFNGVTFRENDVNDLSRTISELLNDKDRLVSIGKNAMATVHDKYTMDSMVSNFKQCIVACSRAF